MSAPVYGTTDKLTLGADWEPQGNSPTSAGTEASETGADGDIIAETVVNVVESGTSTFIYKGALTDFVAAFAAADCDVGQLAATNTLLITAIGIDYSPCAAGQRPMVTFTWRDGPTEAPTTAFCYVTALTLPTYAAANVIVPELIASVSDDSEIKTSKWDLAMQFGEDTDKDGEFLAGQGYAGKETVTQDYAGTPTSLTSTGWLQTSGPGAATGPTTTNAGYATAPYAFSRKVTRSAPAE